MHLSFGLLAGLLLYISTPGWDTDLEAAKAKADKEHKLILLNFSGSDWCGPCIRLHDEIFESETFKEFADKNIILVNADFPRKKKNQLSKEQQDKNDRLAEKYDHDGIFPLTLLLDTKGKVIHTWEGYPNKTADKFVSELNQLCAASR